MLPPISEVLERMIQPKPATIGEILSLSKQFVVPKYQRGYAWDKSEASEFLGDLQSEADAGRGLFLGTLIFDVTGEKEKKMIIVDGQQRLTTVLFLLIACRNLARKIKDEGIAQQTQQRITFVDPTNAKSLGPLLIASESIKDVFDAMCDYSWKGKFSLKVGKRQINRVKPIYDLFADFLGNQDATQLSRLLEAIYKTRVIRIDIEGEEEAFSIFERTNARGADLEISDLLKNYLYQQRVLDLDDKWSQIIGNSKGTILKMLKYFYVSRKGYVSKSELYRKLKQYCREIGGADKLVEELRKFSEFYAVVRKEEGPEVIRKHFDLLGCKSVSTDQDKYEKVHIALQGLRLFKISQIYPLVDAAFTCFVRTGACNNRTQSKVLIKLLDAMEKYHFINNAVCDRIGNEVEKLYAGYCEKYALSKDFDKTTHDFIAALRKQLASEDEFTTRFCQITYSSQNIGLIAYIFDRINNLGLAPGERIPIFSPQPSTKRKNHNIEHFYPQKPDEDVSLDPETRESIDNIGNLLVVSFRANSSLGNLPPRKKIEKMTGELAKKIQNMAYIKTFIQKYEKAFDSWDKKAIAERASQLATEAYREVWKIN
jgi:Protein of unknown function DUF262/Protein of unknown function (DUF1524)